jgi:hypothetical protein
MALNCSWHHWTSDHSQSPHSLKSKESTTLQAFTTIDLNMHFMEIVHWTTRKASPSLAPLTKFGPVTTPTQLIVYMTMRQNLSQPKFKNFFNHMEFDPNWPLSKPSSQQYPRMHPSSNWKSPTFQLPHHSRPWHCICPTRTAHASYVGHQHNIPYNLKGKPSQLNLHSTMTWFFQLPLPPIGMPSTVINKLNHNLLPMPKTANAFCMNSA